MQAFPVAATGGGVTSIVRSDGNSIYICFLALQDVPVAGHGRNVHRFRFGTHSMVPSLISLANTFLMTAYISFCVRLTMAATCMILIKSM
jgi:hypothetical protein